MTTLLLFAILLPAARFDVAVTPLTESGHVRTAAISPDGASVAYIEDQQLCIREISSGRTARRVAGANWLWISYGPDGRDLYYGEVRMEGKQRLSAIYRQPLTGGSPELVAANSYAAAFSPDGLSMVTMRIDAESREQRLAVSGLDGKNARVIAVRPRQAASWTFPAWSPDGATIGWQEIAGTKATILTVPARASREKPREVTRRNGFTGAMVWSAGGFMVMHGEKPITINPTVQLWRVDPAGGEWSAVTEDRVAFQAWSLSVAADGLKLAALRHYTPPGNWWDEVLHLFHPPEKSYTGFANLVLITLHK